MENTSKIERSSYKKDGLPVLFVHLINWHKTLAIHPPSVNDLNYAVNEFVDGAKREAGDEDPAGRFVIMAGVSYLHPRDRYNRKVGRSVSMGKIKPVFAYIKKAIIDKWGILYVTELPEDKITINLFAKHGHSHAEILNGWGYLASTLCKP